MRYEGMVYRPPSEARSLIVQATIGCARNTCTFCSMYKDKTFRVRKTEEIIEDLFSAKKYYGKMIQRIFLADGDALVMKTEQLLEILKACKEIFPYVDRITSYAAPRDVLLKTDEELKALREAGLMMAYVGAESGSDKILEAVQKQATSAEIIEACRRLQNVGIQTSVTLISGLGSRELMEEHALESAKLVTAIKPNYISLLTLMLEPGAPLREAYKKGEFKLLTAKEVAQETLLFLKHTDSEGSVFRSNHASNYVSLAGNLNEDTPRLITSLESALTNDRFKPEAFRGL